MPLAPQLLTVYALGTKAFVLITTQGSQNRNIIYTKTSFFLYWIYTIFGWFLCKAGDLSENSPLYDLVSDCFNFKYILL